MSRTRVQTGGGRFRREDAPVYFIASGVHWIERAAPFHPYVLVAVNELESESAMRLFEKLLDSGATVFLDSGVFNLTNRHMRAHGITMDEALALPPDQIDGFHELYERYVGLVERFSDKLWGYVELDQGGRENKVRTRASLEARGLRPIPVYHALNDGWDYFDFLAKRYDRICCGNLVQAAPDLRRKLLATLSERRAKYPHLWIHLLGVTANHLLAAYPQTSCDSSSWLAGVRWTSSDSDAAALSRFDALPNGFAYAYGMGAENMNPDQPGTLKATTFAAVRAAMRQRNWRAMLASYRRAGLDPLPYQP